MMWWLMFCEAIPYILTSWFPINEEVSLFNPVLHPKKLHNHRLGIFCLTVVVIMTSAAELSILLWFVVGKNLFCGV